MRLVFLCSNLEPGRDGVGDYTRRLAGECIRQGHEAKIISLNDKAEIDHLSSDPDPSSFNQFPDSKFSAFQNFQDSEGTRIECLRLPAHLPWPQRVDFAKEFTDRFAPDWISLQFVPYGFHPKGLPFGLGKHLQRLIASRPLHIMFHELWIGDAGSSPWQHRPVGFLQRSCIRHLLQRLKPVAVHTSIPIYQAMLREVGTRAELLPLFGNISRTDVNAQGATVPLALMGALGTGISDEKIPPWVGVLFGTIASSWNPIPLITQIQTIAKQLKRQLVLVSVGKAGTAAENILAQIRQIFPDVRCEILGQQPDQMISWLMQRAHFGLATTSWLLIGKSGSVAAMLDHGLPVLATCESWQHRSIASSDISPSPRLAGCILHPTANDLLTLRKRPDDQALHSTANSLLTTLSTPRRASP